MILFEAALAASWAMEEAALRSVLEIAAREHNVTPEALEAYRAKALEKAQRASVRDGVAVLPVEGPLFKRANMFAEISGATSYEILRRDLQAAIDDPNVKAILLNINSPGGEVQGTSELAQAIRDARGTKPIVAYAGDLAASAAYWIASAADKIVIGKSAALGSIGVIAGYTDTSARDARSGVQAIKIISSQSPFKQADPTTEAGLVRIQARVDAVADVFIDAVASNRDLPRDHVLSDFGQGDVLIGKAAVAAGMADEIGSFESVLAKLAATEPEDPFAAIRENGVFGMITAEQLAAAEKAAAEKARETALAEARAEHEAAARASADAHAAALTAASAAAATAERERVSKIRGLTLVGYDKEADEAINSGSSPEAFAATLIVLEKAKGEARSQAVKDDAERNAGVTLPPKADALTGDDAAVDAIMGAFKAAKR